MQSFIGTVMLFAGNFAPRGWQLCNGQLLPISQYTALFSLLGTTYGGNGTTNFALPNFQGRVPVDKGQLAGGSTYDLGEEAGSPSTSILISQLPAHTHTAVVTIGANASPQTATTEPANAVLAGGSGQNIYATGAPDGTTKMNAGMATAVVALAGSSLPSPIMQPILVVNFVICIEGIFPSRN